MPGYERLFDGGELSHYFQSLLQRADELVQAIPQDQFMNTRPEEVADHIISQVALIPLTIYVEHAEAAPRETTMDGRYHRG